MTNDRATADSGDDFRAAGWYPRGEDETRQYWYDGRAWTEYQRVSRYPTFVEREGKLVYLDRRLFPRGDGEYELLLRRYQKMLFSALGIILVGPVVLAAALAFSGLQAVAAIFAAVVICGVIGVVLLLLSMGPAIKLSRMARQVRDAYLHDDLYAPVKPPRGAKEKAKARKQGAPPGWA